MLLLSEQILLLLEVSPSYERDDNQKYISNTV